LATTPNIATTIPVVGISKASLQLGDGENAALRYVRLSAFASPSQRIDDTSRSLCRVITSNVTGKINAYYISGPNDVPGKMQFESRTLDTTVFTVIASDSATGGDFNADLTTAASAENEAKPNRLYYSKVSQPESVPIVNYVDVGPQDKRIIRILGLRDSLFIIKEEGIYRLTGADPSNFTVFLFDSGVNVTAADTCVVMDNQIFAMCSQGVVRISETGVDVISQPVQDVFDLTSSPRYTNYTTASFACAYVQDYAYIIWLPEAAADTTGTVAYRFSTKTQTWTSWTKTGNAKCAVVNTNVNKLYVGPDDDNIVEVERKDIKRTDFADRQYELTLPLNSVSGTTITVSSAANITIGDVLLQQQYVTASVITRLARKFVLDNGIPNTVGNSNKDFYRNFTIADGDSFQTKMFQLITQVNSDISAAFNTTYSTPILTFQTEFNALIAVLNADPVLLHTNYLPATQLIEMEMTVTAVNKSLNQVTTKVVPSIATGPIILYKAINCVAVFSPFFFGDPAPLKHVRDATVVFSSANLNGGTVGYNTDLSAAFEDIPFTMEGTGNFGYGAWSGIAWGGEGTARPFRTLVPRAKQRCRFIRTRFKHVSAFDEFRVIGISYTFEVNSERAYR
jgi:hypothetical protein